MLKNYLEIDSGNVSYVNHCIAQQGGIVLNWELREGRKTKPLFYYPITGKRNFGGGLSEVIDSWIEDVIEFNVRPLVNCDGSGVGNIDGNGKGSFDLVYAPRRNILRIDDWMATVARDIASRAVYVPNLGSLRDGIVYCFDDELKGFGFSGDVDKMMELVLPKLSGNTFSPKSMQVGD